MPADKERRMTLISVLGGLAGNDLVAAAAPFVCSPDPAAHRERPYLDVDIGILKDKQINSLFYDPLKVPLQRDF